MLVQVGLEGKVLVAPLALERLEAGVGLDVRAQVGLVGKVLLADVAFEGLFTCGEDQMFEISSWRGFLYCLSYRCVSGCDLVAAKVWRSSFRSEDTCSPGCGSGCAWSRRAWTRRSCRSADTSWPSCQREI